MATYIQPCDTGATRGTWYAKVGSSNYGNSNVRGHTGKRIVGSDTWLNRYGIGFLIDGASESRVPADVLANMTKVELLITVRGSHSCFAIASGPKIYVKGAAADGGYPTGNKQTGECSVAGGSAQDNYPGFTTTATHQVAWSGSPTAGDVIALDVTTLFNDWLGFRTASHDIGFMLVAQDENDTAQNIGWDGPDASGAPQLRFTYDSNTVPDVSGSSGRVPSNASRNTLANCQIFKGTYVDTQDNAAGVGPDFIYIQVADNNSFTSPVLDQSITPTSYNSSTKQWVSNRTIAGLVRGTTYYWRYKLTDSGGGVSVWSPTFTFTPNRLPTNTKVRPT
jgi:hypothetical protein